MHYLDYVVIQITGGRLRYVDPSGNSGTAALAAGRAYDRAAGIEHNVGNPGDTTVVFVEVEMK